MKKENPNKAAVHAWIAEHPNGTATECKTDLTDQGIGASTVFRWFKQIKEAERTAAEDQEVTISPAAETVEQDIAVLQAQLTALTDLVHTLATTVKEEHISETPDSSDVSREINLPNPGDRRKTKPGPKKVTLENGLRLGQERATIIVDSATMDKVRDLAYTRRISLRALMAEILTGYLDGIDDSILEHRPK